MRGPDADGPDFESWVASAYHNRPRPRLDALRELFEDEQRAKAEQAAKDWRTQEIVALKRRLAALEKIYLDRSGGLGGPLVNVLAKSMARTRADGDAGISKLRTELLALIAEEREKTVEMVEKKIDIAFSNRQTMFYRGVHSSENEYSRGDVVTAAGSL